MRKQNLAYDADVREYAFAWLNRMTRGGNRSLLWSEILTFKELSPGGAALAVRPQGIFKPRGMMAALSIKSKHRETRADRKFSYKDGVPVDGIVRYKEQSSRSSYNDWVHDAHRLMLPLVYLRGVSEGEYRPIFPVYVVKFDEKTEISF